MVKPSSKNSRWRVYFFFPVSQLTKHLLLSAKCLALFVLLLPAVALQQLSLECYWLFLVFQGSKVFLVEGSSCSETLEVKDKHHLLSMLGAILTALPSSPGQVWCCLFLPSSGQLKWPKLFSGNTATEREHRTALIKWLVILRGAQGRQGPCSRYEPWGWQPYPCLQPGKLSTIDNVLMEPDICMIQQIFEVHGEKKTLGRVYDQAPEENHPVDPWVLGQAGPAHPIWTTVPGFKDPAETEPRDTGALSDHNWSWKRPKCSHLHQNQAKCSWEVMEGKSSRVICLIIGRIIAKDLTILQPCTTHAQHLPTQLWIHLRVVIGPYG